jgi:excisionase family DNA binding protein
METTTASPPSDTNIGETERLAYSIQESADLLGVDYFSVYRLIQRGKLRACRALRGKLLVPRSELLRLLKSPILTSSPTEYVTRSGCLVPRFDSYWQPYTVNPTQRSGSKRGFLSISISVF